MTKNDSGLYTAYKAKDSRFDGRFFIGISTTGIYCRPVCRAKQPKEENCVFYATAAEAEQAGYRPCLLCRPELAPGMAVTDSADVLADRAAKLLEEICGNGQSLNEIAGRLGCTDRHLRRVFTAKYNVSPIQYLQTCRLLLAKNLLTDTNLSVIDIAMASGFGSVRQFNNLFKNRYSMPPTSLRKKVSDNHKHDGYITLESGYRPPYRFDEILRFLGNRAINGAEAVRNGEYLRTVRIGNSSGWIKVTDQADKNNLSITFSETLLPVLPQVLAKVRCLFDLYCDPETIYETLAVMNKIRPGLCIPGTRVPGSFDSFETSVRAVLGQQITVRAANTLASRLVDKYGAPIETGIDGLTHIFPSPEVIINSETNLEQLGITSSRAKTIKELAKVFINGDINFSICADPNLEMKKLLAISGIGNWTAQYIAMRTMGWTDAFLETDSGVKKAFEPYTSKELLKISEAWRPWRSYAVINIWNTLGG